MTTEHPVTPPPELVEEWMAEIWHEGTPVRVAASDLHIATQAARWGADMELEACCEWVSSDCDLYRSTQPKRLRAARRPKPPSLKAQALEALESLNGDCRLEGFECPEKVAAIRRALEALPDV